MRRCYTLLHFCPGTIVLGAFDDLLDEDHLTDTVLDSGIGAVIDLAFLVGDKGLGEVGVDVGEGFEEALWVASGEPDHALDVVVHASPASADDLHGGVVGLEAEVFRSLLRPFEAAQRAIDTQLELVFLATGDFAQLDDAFGTVAHAEHDGGVVV